LGDTNSRSQRLRLQLISGFRFRFRSIHLVDFAVKRAAADTELFGSGGYVSV